MPISTLERNSNPAGKSKDKKINKNSSSLASEKSILSSNDTTVDGNASQSSGRDTSKDWTSSNDLESSNSNMKSILGRGSKSNSLDPDSSSLGPVETGKEAKEKHKSWVKTIGIRTLKRRNADKEGKTKSHSSIHGLFSRSSDSSKSSIPDAAATTTTSTSGSSTNTGVATTTTTATTAAGEAAGKEHVKLKKTLSAASSSNGNGSDLRSKILSSTASSSSISAPNATTTTNNNNASGGGSTKGSTKSKGKSSDSHAKVSATTSGDKQDPARFTGDGMFFKAKLIGVLEVCGPRGDRICQDALSELKMAVKAAGEHKQKITIHIALDGIRIRDEKTGDCLYHHQVHKISFIAQDLTDARAYGYIFGSPDMGHRFFGIKTEKSANQVVIAMRDLFQVVFDLKKKEIERAKQQLEMQQKFLATRAAETKVEHKPSSSIAETYITTEGACGGGTPSSSSSPRATTAPQEIDLLNLEVELNSLQEGLDNIHHNLADTNIRGSTASISSDPMNPMSGVPKFNANFNSSSNSTGLHNMQQSVSGGGNSNKNFISSSGSDPFGDSFDPFDNSSGYSSIAVGFRNQFPSHQSASSQHQQQQQQQSSLTSPSSVKFTPGGGVGSGIASIDPFIQIDPFPTPKFNNFENSDSYFNSDPFDTPVGNYSFSFGGGGDAAGGVDSSSSVGVSNTNNSVRSISNSNVEESSVSRADHQQHISGMSGWQASFDDNFVLDGSGQTAATNGKGNEGSNVMDIFTELDPLGTGRVRPFVDRKDFFHDLKNPPRRVLKELYSASDFSGAGVQDEGTIPGSGSALENNSIGQQQQQQQGSSKARNWMSFDSDDDNDDENEK